jgi:hypothetical protein
MYINNDYSISLIRYVVVISKSSIHRIIPLRLFQLFVDVDCPRKHVIIDFWSNNFNVPCLRSSSGCNDSSRFLPQSLEAWSIDKPPKIYADVAE